MAVDHLVAGLAECVDVELVVTEASDEDAHPVDIFLRDPQTFLRQVPEGPGFVVGEEDGDRPALAGSQQGSMDIGLVSAFLDIGHHFLITLFRHLAPVVQHPVHRAFRQTGMEGDVFYGQRLVVQIHVHLFQSGDKDKQIF